MLLVLLPLLPILGLPALLAKKRKLDFWPVLLYLASLCLGLYLVQANWQNGPLTFQISLPGPFSPSFYCDGLTAVFSVLASFLWLVLSLYSPGYMPHEGKPRVFKAVTLLTLAAVQGVFLAGDFFTLLLFFEIMTVTSYFWVVHRWDKKAVRAGYFYLFFSIMGGLFLALGMVLLAVSAGQMPSFAKGVTDLVQPELFPWSIALLGAGFGIKAGMFPFHLWLPHAHSAAPTPGSALLSGLLIKVGAYGLARVGLLAGWGGSEGLFLAWFGPALIILGISTMLVGVVSALLQGDAKRLLAYHSVSQMGYIILGLGAGIYLGSAGGLAFIGAIYHIINHALFKAALFLGVGLVYLATKETDLKKLGGLLRSFPWTASLMLIAVLGITGTPGLNGYASKTLLHHAILQAAAEGGAWLSWVERLFSLVGIGTAASFAKLYYLIFLQKTKPRQLAREKFSPGTAALAILSLAILVIGLRPGLLPGKILLPAAQALGLDAANSLAEVNFWQIQDLLSMAVTLVLGTAFCWTGLRWGLFAWVPPRWLTIEGLVGAAVTAGSRAGRALTRQGKALAAWLAARTRTGLARIIRAVREFDQVRHGSVGRISLVGISADAAIVILTLILLVAWYILTDFNLG